MKNKISSENFTKDLTGLPVYVCSFFRMNMKELKSFEIVPKHFAIYLCEKGCTILHTQQKKIILKEQTGVILHKDFHYFFEEDKSRTTAGRMILFDGEYCENIFKYLSIKFDERFAVHSARLDLFWNDLQHYTASMENFKMSLSLQEFFYFIACRKENNKVHFGKIKNVEEFMSLHYCENFSVETLADIYGTSVSYLIRAYKEQYHVTPMARIRELRHMKAKHMLETTDKKIYDISRECGYDNCDYFSAVFKKMEKMTPLQYRKMRKI